MVRGTCGGRCKPDFVVGVHSSRTVVASRLKLPTQESLERTAPPLLLGIAPDGVYHAAPVTRTAVGSYPTISPLPASGRYFFCCTFRRVAPPGSYPASCPVESGLSSRELPHPRTPPPPGG